MRQHSDWRITPSGVCSGGVHLSASDAVALCDFVLRYHSKLALMARLEASDSWYQVCSMGECLLVCGPAQKCGLCKHPCCEKHLYCSLEYDGAQAKTTYHSVCSTCHKEMMR
jgi:hypothetical protein